MQCAYMAVVAVNRPSSVGSVPVRSPPPKFLRRPFSTSRSATERASRRVAIAADTVTLAHACVREGRAAHRTVQACTAGRAGDAALYLIETTESLERDPCFHPPLSDGARHRIPTALPSHTPARGEGGGGCAQYGAGGRVVDAVLVLGAVLNTSPAHAHEAAGEQQNH